MQTGKINAGMLGSILFDLSMINMKKQNTLTSTMTKAAVAITKATDNNSSRLIVRNFLFGRTLRTFASDGKEATFYIPWERAINRNNVKSFYTLFCAAFLVSLGFHQGNSVSFFGSDSSCIDSAVVAESFDCIDYNCRPGTTTCLLEPPRPPQPPRRRQTTIMKVQFGNSTIIDSKTTINNTVAHNNDVTLVLPEDKELISSFLYELMSNVQLVHLQDADRYEYNNLPLGLPGLCCKQCQLKRKMNKYCHDPSSPSSSNKNQSQRPKNGCIFPVCRRTLPIQIRNDLYNHLQRCDHVHPEIKLELKRLKELEISNGPSTTNEIRQIISREERLFCKKLWSRMGHKLTM